MKLRPRRFIGRATGRHRAPRPHAAIVGQRFVTCTVCGVETAATVHGTALLCAEGHLVGGGQ